MYLSRKGHWAGALAICQVSLGDGVGDRTLMLRKETLYRETIIGIFLLSVCLGIFYSSFKYGFVSDDYNRVVIHDWTQLWTAWEEDNFRRPLDELYYMLFYNLFGYDPLPYRIFLWLVYSLNTYLVYRLAHILTMNVFLGVLVAVFFAGNLVQFRNIYWISCNLLLFATTFYLIAALVFLKYLENGRRRELILSFVTALAGLLATKEDLVTFPLTALILTIWITVNRKNRFEKKDFFSAIRMTAIFWTIPLGFIGYRTFMSAALQGLNFCPYNLLDCFQDSSTGGMQDVISDHIEGAKNNYQISFMGFHLIENIGRQLFWNLGSLGGYWPDKLLSSNAGNLEWKQLGSSEYFLILCFLFSFAALYWVFRKSVSGWYPVLGVFWFVGNLLPTLGFPTHVYPYFSALSAIGLFLVLVMPFQSGASCQRLRFVRIVGTMMGVLFLVNSFYWMHTNEKTHRITRTSSMLQQMERDLLIMYPVLPSDTNLVFLNLGNWNLGYSRAPQVIYNDSQLKVYSMEKFVLQNGGIYTRQALDLDKNRTHVFFYTPTGFLEITPIFYQLYSGVLNGS